MTVSCPFQHKLLSNFRKIGSGDQFLQITDFIQQAILLAFLCIRTVSTGINSKASGLNSVISMELPPYCKTTRKQASVVLYR